MAGACTYLWKFRVQVKRTTTRRVCALMATLGQKLKRS